MEANVAEEEVENDARIALAELEDAHITMYNLSVYSFEEMEKEAGNIIITKSKTTADVLTSEGGINDSRMGTLSFTDVCKTCSAQNCPGHMGIILFGKDNEICNPLFIKMIVKILNCVCHSCSRVLFCNEVDKKNMTEELKKILKRSPENRLTELENYCKDKAECPCNYSNVKKVARCLKSVKIKSSEITDDGFIQPKDSKGHVKTLHNKNIIQILSHIPKKDAQYLGFIGDTAPVDLMMRGILVIPPLARPPTTDKNGVIIQNPITLMYLDIVKAVTKGKMPGSVYTAVRSLIVKNNNNRKGGQEIKSISELQQGKKGLFRQSMMGKRTDFNCRTVAGPGEFLAFGQEVLPLEWSLILTKPVKVTNFNIEFLNNLLALKKINYIGDAKGVRKSVNYSRPLPTLLIGQQVEIQLKDKDRIYLNRQPSLTKGSMMGFEIVFEEGQVIKSHLSITTSLNLDHDGDELNVWIPQDYEVEAELEYILNAKNCLISTASGKANMGLVMNSITASHLLSLQGSEVSEVLYYNLITSLTNKEALPSLIDRLNLFGFELFRTDVNGEKHFSGKAVLSALFPPNFTYKHKGVHIYNGIIVSGILTKAHLGPTSRSVVQELVKHYTIYRASDFLTDAPHLLNIYIANRGFSVGISDCENVVVDSKAVQANLQYNKNTQIFDTLHQQLDSLIFTTKTYQDISNIIIKVVDNLDATIRQSYDTGFKKQLASFKIQLSRIDQLVKKVGNKKCGNDIIKLIIEQFRSLSEAKAKQKLYLEKELEKFNTLIDSLKGKTITDPFLIKLRKTAKQIEADYLLVGQHQPIDTNFDVKVASLNDAINQIISRIFESLQPSILADDNTLLNELDQVLRRLLFEGTPNYYLYDDLYRIYKLVKMSYFNPRSIELFFQQLPPQFKNIISSNIIEEDDRLTYTSSNYENLTMIDFLFTLNTQLTQCLLDDKQMAFKNNSILGQFNEILLLINYHIFTNLQNSLNTAYNKNYVIKKEEIAKILLDVESIGSKKNLPLKEAQFKELQLMEKLNIAGAVGATLAGKVSKSNAIVAQTEMGAGTKGSSANVGQIMGAIGQQYMSGKRLWNDHARLSSHFDEDDESPQARGLIESSFLEGLSPTEMFFIQAAGRESVIETYMNTPIIGKLLRFMERALENVIIAYDGSVRNNMGFLYATSYNMGFGIDKMLAVGTEEKPLLTNFIDINLMMDKYNQERGWYSINELKKTNLKITNKSLEDQFTDALKGKLVEPILIKSEYQNAEQKLTLFEKARIIGIRAQMLNENDVPRVATTLTDALDIAKLEYEQGLLAAEPALFIIRTLPNGTKVRVYPTIANII